MKNNKGFTLVELLAAVIILSLLVVFSIPLITSLMEKSRAKIYVDDAKKLVGQAEYQMKKLEEDTIQGKCFVMSLGYMGSSILDAGPNGGVYDKNNSFVVIKDTTGNSLEYVKYEYSVRLVEIINSGGYKGIDLKKIKDIKYDDALNEVSEISNNSVNITMSYINSKLGSNYCTSFQIIG